MLLIIDIINIGETYNFIIGDFWQNWFTNMKPVSNQY